MNFVMQISLFVICALAAACSIAILVIMIVKLLKGKKRLTKEEKAKVKEEAARKELNDQLAAINAKLIKLNTKK